MCGVTAGPIRMISTLVSRFTRPRIKRLIRDRELFDQTIYTPLPEALKILAKRGLDVGLERKVSALLGGDIPQPLIHKPQAVLFRQVATPNYEIRRFFSLIDSIEGLEPLFWEYHQDKFTSNNEWKHSLGKLFFYQGKGKKGGAKIDTAKIIDFNTWNGKPLHEVTTLWNQPLIDFHHEFFSARFREVGSIFFDATDWFIRQGKQASKYYESFLTLFVRHGILFENFMLDQKEVEFTEKVFLPAFFAVWEKTGQKPLIVSLEPTDIEGDQFWICHPEEHKDFVIQKLDQAKAG